MRPVHYREVRSNPLKYVRNFIFDPFLRFFPVWLSRLCLRKSVPGYPWCPDCQVSGLSWYYCTVLCKPYHLHYPSCGNFGCQRRQQRWRQQTQPWRVVQYFGTPSYQVYCNTISKTQGLWHCKTSSYPGKLQHCLKQTRITAPWQLLMYRKAAHYSCDKQMRGVAPQYLLILG